ncbi:MAG: hypothetical protein JMDDDDMK_00106 [Acidobacteria bacterium]|nr:hypothetical protein [Acidobacteriota bacterium]
MFPKPIFILFLLFVLGCAQQQADDLPLPDLLSETEKQMILKEQNPKPHVKAVLRVAEARIKSASLLSQDNQIQSAAQDLGAFLALVIYADTYTRKLPAAKNKDRNHCLKQIEQAIFKQTRTLEAATRALPLEARESVEAQIDEVKKIRLRAINDLLGGGHVINSSN